MAFFSIIITSYNQAGFIRNAVASAVTQAHGNKEIIVVDDGSSDGSQRILEEYGDTIRLARLDTNMGASRARNVGIALARGDFLCLYRFRPRVVGNIDDGFEGQQGFAGKPNHDCPCP